jgi:hypothetical protein
MGNQKFCALDAFDVGTATISAIEILFPHLDVSLAKRAEIAIATFSNPVLAPVLS